MESTRLNGGSQGPPRRVLKPRDPSAYDSRVHGQMDPRIKPTANPDPLGDAGIGVTDLPMDILRKRLRGMRGDRPTFMACCPAHHDTKPSLSVTEKPDGTVLLHCHANCPVENVLDALGIRLCHLFPSGYARQFNQRAPDLRPTPARPTLGPVDEPDIDHDHFRQIIREARAGARRKLSRFAGELGVTLEALALLRVGVANGRLVFPERDDRRRPVGICYRSWDGLRSFEDGGKRGLTIPREQPTADGPLYVAEGGTDTAALLSAGVRAIGRPAAKSSRLATHWLVRYLDRQSGRIVVLGDNDDPESGEGVGEVAARELAAGLAGRLGRRVVWALPRPGFKDIRDQIAAGEWSRGVLLREVRA